MRVRRNAGSDFAEAARRWMAVRRTFPCAPRALCGVPCACARSASWTRPMPSLAGHSAGPLMSSPLCWITAGSPMRAVTGKRCTGAGWACGIGIRPATSAPHGRCISWAERPTPTRCSWKPGDAIRSPRRSRSSKRGSPKKPAGSPRPTVWATVRQRFPLMRVGYAEGLRLLRMQRDWGAAEPVAAAAIDRFPAEPWPLAEDAHVAHARRTGPRPPNAGPRSALPFPTGKTAAAVRRGPGAGWPCRGSRSRARRASGARRAPTVRAAVSPARLTPRAADDAER